MVRSEVSMPIVLAMLLAAGLVVLGSAAPDLLPRQATALGVGLVGCAALMWLGRRRILRLAFPLYGFTLFLLVLTQLIGSERNGAQSWLDLGPLPAFQPSELAKIALILALATVMHERPIGSLLSYLRPVVLIGLPAGLVFLEPDLGSAVVLAAVGGAMMLVRGIPWRHLVLFATLFAVAVPTVLWPNLNPNQRTRLVSFLNPAADPQGSGYQVIQSTIAVGSGGLLGKGYRQGTQAQFGFIPFGHTDFIFPVLAEEGGFVAAIGLLALYGLLFWRLVAMASECPYERDQLAIIGILILIGFQVVVNVGVTLGLAPVTGITLPLISFGGTSLIATMAALCLAFVIHRDRYKDW